MDSMGDALEGSAAAVPEIAALVQFLSQHAALTLAVVLIVLLLIVALAEVFDPERRRAAAADQPTQTRSKTGPGSGR